ncbi:MAG: tryptophan synthase subunit alpha [Actinomycetota bacterium]
MAETKPASDPGTPERGAEDVPGLGIRRIEAAFEAARSEGRAALMPYMMAGFPGREAALEIARAYADAGADLVEIGVPFSDPLADGPVIHAAATAALERGASLDDALRACEVLGEGVPAVAMCYVNMILALGPRRFAGRLAKSGAAGAIVPDLPLEEAGEIRAALDEEGLALVPLIAPTTPAERRRRICEAARGFVYVVSDVGVTGERDELPPRLSDLVAATKEDTGLPVAVGFGIGTPQQAATVGSVADGVIIGSRLVRAAGEAGNDAAAAVGSFLRETRDALAA